MKTLRMCLALAMVAAATQLAAQSPYAGQETRAIKALSDDEVRDYLAGKGMGLARAAELNGYPGPMHVLELAQPLGLTSEQRARTEALFARMRERAIAAGRALVDAEVELDAMFRGRKATDDELARAMARIGERQAEVRRVHLQAHIEQAALLTPQQNERYGQLRGYAGGAPAKHHPGMRH